MQLMQIANTLIGMGTPWIRPNILFAGHLRGACKGGTPVTVAEGLYGSTDLSFSNGNHYAAGPNERKN
jgi:hypothetical protein